MLCGTSKWNEILFSPRWSLISPLRNLGPLFQNGGPRFLALFPNLMLHPKSVNNLGPPFQNGGSRSIGEENPLLLMRRGSESVGTWAGYLFYFVIVFFLRGKAQIWYLFDVECVLANDQWLEIFHMLLQPALDVKKMKNLGFEENMYQMWDCLRWTQYNPRNKWC